jgi:hypothetical protein
MRRNAVSADAIVVYANQYTVVTKNGHKGYDPRLPFVYTLVDFRDCSQQKVGHPVSCIAPIPIRPR